MPERDFLFWANTDNVLRMLEPYNEDCSKQKQGFVFASKLQIKLPLFDFRSMHWMIKNSTFFPPALPQIMFSRRLFPQSSLTVESCLVATPLVVRLVSDREPKMRRLSRRKALSLVKELDAFPKVSESYVETSASGGTGETSSLGGQKWRRMRRRRTVDALCSSTVSLIAFSAMAVLAVLEFFVYRDTWMKYEYEVDKDFSRWARIGEKKPFLSYEYGSSLQPTSVLLCVAAN